MRPHFAEHQLLSFALPSSTFGRELGGARDERDLRINPLRRAPAAPPFHRHSPGYLLGQEERHAHAGQVGDIAPRPPRRALARCAMRYCTQPGVETRHAVLDVRLDALTVASRMNGGLRSGDLRTPPRS